MFIKIVLLYELAVCNVSCILYRNMMIYLPHGHNSDLTPLFLYYPSQISDLLKAIRIQTLEIIETIYEYKQKYNMIINPFVYSNNNTPNTTTSTNSSSNNINYLIKIATDLDFIDQYTILTHTVYGYEFRYNPLAYPAGGSIITLNNQKFDNFSSGGGDRFIPPQNQPINRYPHRQQTDQQEYDIEYDIERLQHAERVVQWEIDLSHIPPDKLHTLHNTHSNNTNSNSSSNNKYGSKRKAHIGEGKVIYTSNTSAASEMKCKSNTGVEAAGYNIYGDNNNSISNNSSSIYAQQQQQEDDESVIILTTEGSIDSLTVDTTTQNYDPLLRGRKMGPGRAGQLKPVVLIPTAK